MLVRAVAFPDSAQPGYAVVVDLLLNDDVRAQLQRDTGVELKSVSAVLPPAGETPLRSRCAAATAPSRRPRRRALSSGLLNNLGSLMEYRDWDTGETRHAAGDRRG